MSAQLQDPLTLAEACEESAELWANEIDTRLKAAAELRRLLAENAELQRVLRLARELLYTYLQGMIDCNTNQVTGLIEDANLLLVIESEQDLINQIDAAIAQAGVEA